MNRPERIGIPECERQAQPSRDSDSSAWIAEFSKLYPNLWKKVSEGFPEVGADSPDDDEVPY